MEALQLIREKGKCCISNAPMKDSGHINLLELDFKATWEYPTAGNIIYGIRNIAMAFAHDDCFGADGKMIGKVKFAIEFKDNDIIYHPVPEIRRCSVCGCHQLDACYHNDLGACWWVDKHLCSHCSLFPGKAKRFSKIMREIEANNYTEDVAQLLKYEIVKFHLLNNQR